ncbi:MAG: GHKL domain-containing protein [Bacteroidales bacterium]|nr:GHKL domain-containing protein [Bacteroidales bacterium]
MDFSFNIISWLLVVILAAILVLLIHHYFLQKRRMGYLLQYIESNDYSFRFHNGHVADKSTTKMLNKIVETLGIVADNYRQREQYFELILNSVDTGIIVADSKGHILQSNYAAYSLLRRNVLTFLDQVFPVDENRLSVKSANMTLQGEKVTVFAINDIHKELENKEMESWESITRVLTHEIMNSVTPITSLCNTLLEKAPEGSQMQQGLATISKTGKGLIEFVENYRQFTRVPNPQPALFYVKPFVEQMVALALHQREDCKLQIKTSIEPSDLIVYADEGLISRVFTNLLKNALQAVGADNKKGIISIKAYLSEQESVIIDVSNNGPMIPKEDREQIFVPFFTTKADGSGIGLSLSRSIMKKNGGELSLLCDEKRNITTFRLLFT